MTKKLQRLVAMLLCPQIINKCNYRCKTKMNDLKIMILSQCGLKKWHWHTEKFLFRIIVAWSQKVILLHSLIICFDLSYEWSHCLVFNYSIQVWFTSRRRKTMLTFLFKFSIHKITNGDWFMRNDTVWLSYI